MLERTTTAPDAVPGPAVTDRRCWASACLASAQLMVILDVSVVNVALPTIGSQLHSTARC